VRHHHTEGFLDPQVKGVVHVLSNVLAQSMETTRHGALGLRLALLNPLACLEGSGLQLFQLLLRGVVGRLDNLRLGRRDSLELSASLKTENANQNWERIPNKLSQQAKGKKDDSPSTCFFSVSRATRAVSASCCRSRIVASFSSPAWR
jgi:hypothetical protein